LHAGRGIFREAAAGVTVYLAALPALVGAMLLTAFLIKLTGHTPSHPIAHQISTEPARVVSLFALASLFAPVTEEVMFRGVLYHHLRGRWGAIVSGVVVAFIFAVIHPQGWLGLPPLMVLALTFSAMREWRGSLVGPVVVHGLHNGAMLTISVLAMG
jgi:membrane protease YdiL (CAAX protease family)